MVNEKFTSKIVGFILCFLFVALGILGISLFQANVRNPNTVYAATDGDWEYTLDSNNKATIIAYNGSTVGTSSSPLTIPGTVGGYTVIAVGEEGATDNIFTNIASTVAYFKIPNSVTTINSYAFSNCTALKSVTFAAYTTTCKLATINKYAFAWSGLTTFKVPRGVTEIYKAAFGGCPDLTTIQIDGRTEVKFGVSGNTSWVATKVVNGKETHYVSKNLRTFTLYGSSSSLYRVNNGGTATNRLLLRYKSASEQDLVTCAPGKESSGTGHYNLTVPANTKTLYRACFEWCQFMDSCAFADNTLENIGILAFGVCTGLTSITLPTSVKKLYKMAFYNCSYLVTVGLPNNLTDRGNDVFTGCNSLKNFTVPSSSVYTVINDTNGSVVYSTVGSVKSICFVAPAYGSEVEGDDEEVSISYTIPNYITNIAPYAFERSKITEIIIPSNSALVKDGLSTSAFKKSSVAKFTINGTHSNLVTYEDALYWVGESNASLMRFPPAKLAKDETDSYAIPSSVSGKPVTELMNGAFYHIVELVSISIPEGVQTIGSSAFRLCTNLQSVTIPSTVETIGVASGSGAFSFCTSLSEVNILSQTISFSTKTFIDGMEGVVFNTMTKQVYDFLNAHNTTAYFSPNPEFYCENPTIKITLNDIIGNEVQEIYASGAYGNCKIYPSYSAAVAALEEGGTDAYITSISVPSRSNYTFLGYYSAASGGTQYIDASGNFVNDLANKFSIDTTLYARYKMKIPTIWSSLGGAVTLEYADNVEQIVRVTAVNEYSENSFVGWYLSGDDTLKSDASSYYFNASEVSEKTIKAFFVTYNSSTAVNWGLATTYGGTVYAQAAAGTTTIKFQAVPTKEDYVFKGWRKFNGSTGLEDASTTPALNELPYISLTTSALSGKTLIAEFEYVPHPEVNKVINMKPAILPKGETFAGYISSTTTRIYFDWYSDDAGTQYIVDGTNKISGVSPTNISTNSYPIYKYVVGDDIYILTTKDTYIYANADCKSMFYNKPTLNKIIFNNFDTSRVTTMRSMFNTTGITSIDLSMFDTSNVTTMMYMFYTCTQLVEVDLSSFDTSNVTDMSYMFYKCNKLAKLDLSHFNVGSVTTFYLTFCQCYALKELNLTGWSTSGALTTTREMFADARAVKTIDLSGFVTTNVTTMYRMFYNCYALTSLNLSNFNTAKVTTMYEMFDNCSELTSLNISSFTGDACTNMYLMFGYCSNLTTLNMTNLTTPLVTTMYGMFLGCSKLTTLNLNNFNTANVENMQAMFSRCQSLSSLSINGTNWNTTKVTTMRYMFYHCESLTALDLSKFNTSAVTTFYGMFEGCTKLATITKTSTFKATSATTTMYHMFMGCEKLTTFDFSGFVTTGVTNMEGIFQNCKVIDNLNLSSWTFSAVTTLKSAFENCTNLSTLNVTSWNVGNVTTLYNTFYNCSKLTELNATSWNVAKVTTLQGTFFGCSNLKNLYLGSWNTAAVTNMYGTFAGCVNLKILDVSGWNTAKVTNMRTMFKDLSYVRTLFLDNFNTAKVTNMLEMFSGDRRLETIYVGSGWSVSKVGAANSADMFYDCYRLRNHDVTKLNKYQANTKSTGYLTGQTPLTLATGANFATALGTTVKIISFDWYTDDAGTQYCPTGVGQLDMISGITGTNVSANGTDNIKLYISGTTAYVLTPKTNRIMANANCEGMFSSKTTITNIYLNNFDTSNVTTMKDMFYGCTNLVNIYGTSNFNTSNVTTFYRIVGGCTKLTNIDVSNFDTHKATNMYGMFYNCQKLVNVDVSNFVVDSVSDLRCMFQNCYLLKYLSLGNWHAPNAKNLYRVFMHCRELTYVDISCFSAATNMQETFSNCRKVTFLDLTSLTTTSSLTTMNGTFTNCYLATKIDLSTFNTSKVTNMNNTFSGCSVLKTIQVGSSWSTSAVTSSTSMFSGCSALPNYNSSTIDKTNANTTSTGYLTAVRNQAVLNANSFASGLTKTSVTEIVFDWYTNTAGTQYSPSGTNLINGLSATNISSTSGYAINRYVSGTKVYVLTLPTIEIMAPASCKQLFYNFSEATSITFNNFNTKNVTTMFRMFSTCKKLTSLDLSVFDTRNVTTFYAMFYLCNALTNLNVTSFNTEKAASMSNMFHYCNKITTIDVSHFDTKNVQIFYRMFRLCSKITTLDVSGFDTRSATSMTEMFSYMYVVSALDVSNFDTSNVIYMQSMFYQNRALTTLDLSSFDTSQVTTMKNMFYMTSSSSLASIYVGKMWRINDSVSDEEVVENEEDGDDEGSGEDESEFDGTNMFYGCTALVGQDGTTYSASVVDSSVAHTGEGGYLRAK